MEISVDFFYAVATHMEKCYGPKMVDDNKFNEILKHLTKVERLWQLLEDDKPKENRND